MSEPLVNQLAQAWARAIARTSYVPMARRELVEYLTIPATRLVDLLRADDFDHQIPYGVGAALVGDHFTEPASLDRTLAVLGQQLVGPAVDLGRLDRLAAIQGAVAAGFARTLKDRTFEEQERIRAAAMVAQAAAEEARWSSEARFQAVFAEAAIGIGVAGIDGTIIEVNQAICDMFGYRREDFLRHTVEMFIHPDDAPGVWDTYQELIRGAREHFRLEKPYARSDGEKIWTDLVVSLVRSHDGRPRFIVAMVEDITERHRLQTQLRHQALHDPLTDLPNRTLFFDRLAEVLDDPQPGARVGICYLDVDGFKAINDTLGHDAGDRLLRTVAGRLADSLAESGHLVARMGGDEFVILVEHSKGTEELVKLAETALAALRLPVRLDGHALSVSASIGLVDRPISGTTGADLMKAADTTLYWAKGDGRDRWALFDAERFAADVSRYRLSAELPRALAQGEFFVEYQPLVRLRDGGLEGVEALVRWRHPEYGVLSPDRFVPLAEETGLIVPLGRWVLREACQQARAWRQAYPDQPLLVSVNVAVRQVHQPTIVDDVAQVLSETGLDPSSLQLELTESTVMGTTGQPLDRLRALAALGVRIAIDDFGTGYSNLAYLRNLPVTGLKLAGSFVTGRHRDDLPDPVDRKILATLVNLAHALDLTVTAEGVETAEQSTLLAALGCDLVQGWHYARSGPADAITDRLAAA